jgi:hypothetical protein
VGIWRSEQRKFPCYCCSFWTLTEPLYGSYEICPVCFWEDDPVQNSDPNFTGGANHVSLTQAQRNYIRFGASEKYFIDKVRPPDLEEIPLVHSSTNAGLEAAMMRGIKSAILQMARSILSGRIDVIDGCFKMADLGYRLGDSPPLSVTLTRFEMVAAEVGDLPAGSVRDFWDSGALTVKDYEIATYAQQIADRIFDPCRLLEKQINLTGCD